MIKLSSSSVAGSALCFVLALDAPATYWRLDHWILARRGSEDLAQQGIGVGVGHRRVLWKFAIEPEAYSLFRDRSHRQLTQMRQDTSVQKVPVVLASSCLQRLPVTAFVGLQPLGCEIAQCGAGPVLDLRSDRRRGPLVPLDHAVLIAQPALGVELGLEGRGRVVAPKVGADVASLIPA